MGIKNIVMGIGIIILTIFVTMYGINTFYPSPEYEDFCEESRTANFIDSEEACIANEGKWTTYDEPVPKRIEGETQITGYCDRDHYCRVDYEAAREKHSKIVFFIALPLGILIIIIGAALFALEAVGAGLMGGGVGTLIFGVGGYWQYSDNLLKFVLSLIGLVVLIWFAYWINKQSEKGKWKKKLKKIL
jgi:hypothetical protein